MLNQIKQQIKLLKGMGATYVDTRWYPSEEANSLVMWNGNLKEASFSRESGIGVRVLYNGAWGFSASSDVSDLTGLYNNAFDNARTAAQRAYPLKTSPPVFMLEIGNPALFSIVGRMNYLLHMEHKTDGLVHPQAHFLNHSHLHHYWSTIPPGERP